MAPPREEGGRGKGHAPREIGEFPVQEVQGMAMRCLGISLRWARWFWGDGEERKLLSEKVDGLSGG